MTHEAGNIDVEPAVRAAGSIYAEATPARAHALSELWELLHRIGFALRRQSPRESTLRVYPARCGRYPLLNPRFYVTARDLDERFPGESLVLDVYTRPKDTVWAERLRRFPSSPQCGFIEDGIERKDGYYHHGHFIVPLKFVGKPKEEVVDFPMLEKPLTMMCRFLNDRPLT